MQKFLERPGAMAHGMFLRRIDFGEGLVHAVGDENGIIAEAVIAALIDAGEQASVIGEIIAGQKGCEIHGAPGQWGETAAWTASHDA